jgi:hypothetical protein
MASSQGNTGLNECFHYLSEDIHLYETVVMLAFSSLIVYFIDLPIVYKSLVLACRKEFKGFNKDVRSIETLFTLLQVIILALSVYGSHSNRDLYSALTITTIASAIQILIYFVNNVLGCLLALLLLGFLSSGLIYNLVLDDAIFSSILLFMQALLVYIIVPSLHFIKFNYCFARLAAIPYSRYLGIWLFLQIYWSVFQVCLLIVKLIQRNYDLTDHHADSL